MSFTLTDAERKALDLQSAAVGEEQFVEVLPDVAGYGRAQIAQVATIAAVVAGGHFSTPQVYAAERLGMRVSTCDERPAIVRVVDESGAALETRGSATSGDWFESDKNDPGTVFVDLSCSEVVSIRRADGYGLILRPGPNGFTIAGFHPPVSEIASQVTLRAPVAEWEAVCRDPWLRGELDQRARLDNGWQHAIAAGMCARLEAPPEKPARYVERLLAREKIPRADTALKRRGPAREALRDENLPWAAEALSWELPPSGAARSLREVRLFQLAPSSPTPRTWARELASAQAKSLSDFAVVVADRIREILQDLYQRMTPAEESWLLSFHAVCLKRDDLESVRLILAERGSAERLGKALGRVDEAGRHLVVSIPRVLTLNDERLYRARLADPDAWWALFAEPEKEA